MTEAERALARRMAFDLKKPLAEIAAALGRNRSSIHRALQRPKRAAPVGRPRALTKGNVSTIVKTAERMVRAADAKQEVTVGMVIARAGVSASPRTVLRAMHSEGVYFRRLRTKPRLTEDDVRARLAFAKKYHKKTEVWAG